jgi:hypothetical protein
VIKYSGERQKMFNFMRNKITDYSRIKNIAKEIGYYKTIRWYHFFVISKIQNDMLEEIKLVPYSQSYYKFYAKRYNLKLTEIRENPEKFRATISLKGKKKNFEKYLKKVNRERLGINVEFKLTGKEK